MTSDPIPNAISSPGWGSGLLPSDSLGGMTTSQFGRALAPANLSARQAREAGLLTSGIYGLRSSTSLRSAALKSSAESRLQKSLDCCGATLFKLTWKDWGTPSGGSCLVQRVSAPRMGESGNIGSHWPTPVGPTRTGPGFTGREGGADLRTVARWTTPSARDHKDTPGMGAQRPDGKSRDDQLPRQAYLCGPTRLKGSGEIRTGFSAKIINGGQLSPSLPRWLMGCPEAWERSGPGYASYMMLQALAQIHYETQSATGSEASGDMETP